LSFNIQQSAVLTGKKNCEKQVSEKTARLLLAVFLASFSPAEKEGKKKKRNFIRSCSLCCLVSAELPPFEGFVSYLLIGG